MMNRRNWVVVASIAATATALLIWPPPTTQLLAEALQPFKEVKSFACEMVPLMGGKPVEGGTNITLKLTWAAPGSLRTEMFTGDMPLTTVIVPHGKAGVLIRHGNRTCATIDKTPRGQEAAVLKLVGGLAAYSSGNQKPAGSDEIGEVQAPRFDLKVADPEAKGEVWRYRVWVHPTTKRPLRVEFAMQAGLDPAAEGMAALRLEKFEWDVKTDGKFDPVQPVWYDTATSTPVEAVNLATKRIVAALKAYQSTVGGYPKAEPFDHLKAVAELEKRSTEKQPDVEVVQGLVLIGALLATSQETVYRGKTVGPADKEKVLLRWKCEDGSYRVIFGDLRTETVSAVKLKELEGK
jgi:hypothetical protein